MEKDLRKYNLEERLVDFAVMVIDLIENLPSNKACTHLGNQLIRSGTAPALIYGEAQSAESRKDFIHKMALAIKELRESRMCLLILNKKKFGDRSLVVKTLGECEQLVAIFQKSILTAKQNQQKNA